MSGFRHGLLQRPRPLNPIGALVVGGEPLQPARQHKTYLASVVQVEHPRDLPVLVLCAGLHDAYLVDPEQVCVGLPGREAGGPQHRQADGVAELFVAF